MATSGRVRIASLPRTANKRRRIVDHLQARRIVRLAERDEDDAARARGLQFGCGLLARADAAGPHGAAAAGEAGQGVERRRARRRND